MEILFINSRLLRFKAVKNADKAGLLEALKTIRNTIITLTASFLRTNGKYIAVVK